VQPVDAAVLVRAAADGDESAWAELVERYSGLVWSVARAHRLATADAEEVFQTTWLRLTEHVARLKEPERVAAWLATTARNESLKAIRAAKRSAPTDDLDALDHGDDATPERHLLESEAAADDARLRGRLWSAFQQLPDRCRDLLRVLIATPPLSYAEISATFGIAIGSIGPTRGRCLRQLRELLETEGSG
jgi:RNA polymerase sigma factor (sigma-70 family)